MWGKITSLAEGGLLSEKERAYFNKVMLNDTKRKEERRNIQNEKLRVFQKQTMEMNEKLLSRQHQQIVDKAIKSVQKTQELVFHHDKSDAPQRALLMRLFDPENAGSLIDNALKKNTEQLTAVINNAQSVNLITLLTAIQAS
jgi:tRNA G18 (ribose-2'-O)-methylase SpoU